MTRPRDEQLREIEGLLRQSVRSVTSHPSRKPFYWGGLAGYQQLKAIAEALSPIPITKVDGHLEGHDGDYLQELLAFVNDVLKDNRRVYEDLKAAHTLLYQVADCLRYPIQSLRAGEETAVDRGTLSSQQIQQEIEALIQQPLPNRKLFPAQVAVAKKLQRAWKSYGRDLLPCYDIGGLPPDNLKMEALFGRVRRHQRRISGRKSTKELQEFGHYQILFLATSESNLLEQLQQVPVAEYQKHRQNLAKAEEPRQRRSRFHRNPLKAIQQLVKDHHARRADLSASLTPQSALSVS